MTFLNPYWGKNLIGFFTLFFQRLFELCTGALPFSSLASDEIQIAVLFCIALSATLVGGFLLLQKMAMQANSLSHTILLGIILSSLIFRSAGILDLSSLLVASLLAAGLTLLLTEGFHHLLRIQREASVGIVFSALFALGVVLATVFTRNAHLGLESVMGSVDALSREDLSLVSVVTGFNLLVIALLFRPLLLVSFDVGFAKSQGISPRLISLVLMFQIAMTSVSAFRAVGVLLVLAFFTIPFATARLYSSRTQQIFPLAVGFALFASFFGVAFSRHILSVYEFPLSTGGVVVSLLSLVYLGSLLFSPKGIVSAYLIRQAAKAELTSEETVGAEL